MCVVSEWEINAPLRDERDRGCVTERLRHQHNLIYNGHPSQFGLAGAAVSICCSNRDSFRRAASWQIYREPNLGGLSRGAVGGMRGHDAAGLLIGAVELDDGCLDDECPGETGTGSARKVAIVPAVYVK